jgi:hypothetical protein
LTTAPRIKPTSIFLRSARRPNPGRRSTYRRGIIVQTTGTGSLVLSAAARGTDSSMENLPDCPLQGSAHGERANPLLDRLQEEGIPVIVITGYTEVSLQPGKVEAILPKPVSVEQFLAILRPIVARLPDR